MNLFKIPKYIFQKWQIKNITEELNGLVMSWRNNNPHYAYALFDDNDCEEFIKNNFEENVFKAYSRIIPGAFKADLWRYCVLYIYGGVYVDIDTLCLGNIDDFLNEDLEFMTPIDLNNNPNLGQYNLFNCFIASIPRHPILMDCIKRIIFNVENNIVPFSNLDFTGPGILGKATNIYLGNYENDSFIGKEGECNNIKLLKFEQGIEYVKDEHENILFQNKNGNSTIIEIYNKEIENINYIDWGKCKNPIKLIDDTICNNDILNKEILNNYCSLLDYQPDLFKVYNFDNKKRLGSNVDNGYVVGLLDIEYDCYISAGISNDDSFTIGFLDKYNIDINNCFAFDGTVNELPKNIENKIQFIKKNIGPINNHSITNLSHYLLKYKNICLKMDIEGSEWEWINSINQEHLSNISQLVIELHGITNSSWHNNFKFNSFNTSILDKINSLRKINTTHYLIHAHGNNADRITYTGIPNVIELTFIAKRHFNIMPKLNEKELPDREIDFPNEKYAPDIDLNFFPFVNKININPFLIEIEDKIAYDNIDYIDIQNKLNEKNIDSLIETMYKDKNKFYDINDFKSRIKRGIKQQLINKDNETPKKHLYKIGNHDSNKNCIVCCTSLKNENDDSRFVSSNNIIESLTQVGYNGHFYLFNGGFPNPTGKEMKYVGVPYCFKIFMMLEAYKLGFNNVLWIDSGCYALNNLDNLFEQIEKYNIICKIIKTYNNYNAMSFEKTILLLNQLTKSNLYEAAYLETITLGLNMDSGLIKDFIAEYYEMVDLGWPFFSIFPEEIVISAIFNKPKYRHLLQREIYIGNKLYIHEKYANENLAREQGYYFHHKNYIKKVNDKANNGKMVTFQDNGGRLGNQLFAYMMSKLITIKYGHTYNSIDIVDTTNFVSIDENNINDLFDGKIDSNNNILLFGYFQKSDYFIENRKDLIETIYNNKNDDYFIMNNTKCFIKDYLINSKHSLKMNENDIVMSLRLDDFIQYPCKTSDIIPPQYYMDILKNTTINSNLYIVCDKIKHDWEFKYIEYFNKWNPILLQNDLISDIALMRDCDNLIHSNSTLCWIISFLSNKHKRIIPFTPKIYMNQNQKLDKIESNDILNYVNPLTHEEIRNLDYFSNNNIHPFSFYIPDECIVTEIPLKSRLLASIIPGDLSTYIFKNKEKEYNDMYKKSRFALTKKKGGWDCLRHYEILMNGCIPLFENLNDCPIFTITTYPKHLNTQAYELYNNWIENEEYINKYNLLLNEYLEHSRNNCTISSQTKYFLSKIKDGDKVKNILMITGHKDTNYNRESLWIGLKRHIKNIGGTSVEYEKNMFIYTDTIYNNHFTYTNRVPIEEYTSMSKEEIIEKINSQYWDLIIYGKVGPDEYCDFPFFELIKQKYNKDKIAFIFGGDEIFNLKQNNCNNYHINMFGVAIKYQPYIDYLNYYKHFGTCFVRELDM